MLDQAFDALKSYDWGTDRTALNAIDAAVVATQKDAADRLELENRLAAVLKADVSRDAKDFVCRKLMVIGTAASVPALAELLTNEDLSHMARYALERIPAPEAGQAMRDALPKLSDQLKVGVIGSLGVRGDAANVPVLAKLLGDSEAVASAAAFALGAIRSPEAAQALGSAKPSSGVVKQAATDASFACAEGLLASGKNAEAKAIYLQFAKGEQPKHIRLAATRGMLASAGQK